MVGRTQTDLQRIASFYNDRCKELGDDIGSVGWKDKKSQFLRFEMLFRELSVKGKSILDLGCGFGDLVEYLEKESGGKFSYIGVDISKSHLDIARQKHTKNNVEFREGDIFDLSFEGLEFDIVVESGMLNYQISDNMKYTEKVLSESFRVASEAVSFNFLTDRVDYKLEKNFHYSPEKLLEKALQITPYVCLYNDYPLYEFTLTLKKMVSVR